jgi:hypothetical protein
MEIVPTTIGQEPREDAEHGQPGSGQTMMAIPAAIESSPGPNPAVSPAPAGSGR